MKTPIRIMLTCDRGEYDFETVWNWYFIHEGQRYEGYDFVSQESALADAQSYIRTELAKLHAGNEVTK